MVVVMVVMILLLDDNTVVNADIHSHLHPSILSSLPIPPLLFSLPPSQRAYSGGFRPSEVALRGKAPCQDRIRSGWLRCVCVNGGWDVEMWMWMWMWILDARR